MATLTIRNLPVAVVKALKRRAKNSHRSLEAEVRSILEEMAIYDDAFVIAELDRIAAMTPKDRPQTDSTKLLREDRDR